MKFKNKFSEQYAGLLEGQYDCIDRIVLNAYYPKLLSGGGLRDWWRQLKGGDSGLNTASLMHMAGVVSQRVQAWCKKNSIPFIHYQTGERKYEDAEKLLPKDAYFEGIFAIFCSRAPSLLWEVHEFGNGKMMYAVKRKHHRSIIIIFILRISNGGTYVSACVHIRHSVVMLY